MFVHLGGARDVLAARLQQRSNHFMPPSLLDTQLQTLEPLGAGERGIAVP
jgi:gluconate kinase